MVHVGVLRNTYILINARQNLKSPNHTRKRVKKTLLGKRLATTLPAPPTERIHAVPVRIGLFRAAFAFEESLGHKSVRVGEVARMSVDGPHVACEVGAGWKVVAFVIEIDGVGMRDAA